METSVKLNLIKELTTKHADYVGQEILHIKNKEFTPETFSVEMKKLFTDEMTVEDFEKKFNEWLETLS